MHVAAEMETGANLSWRPRITGRRRRVLPKVMQGGGDDILNVDTIDVDESETPGNCNKATTR